MRIIFELSGEHSALPQAEILSVLEAENIELNVIENPEKLLIIETDNFNFNKVKNRLALSFLIDEEIINFKPRNINEIIEKAKDLNIGKGTFCVRAKRIGNNFNKISTKEIENKFGKQIKNNSVDLLYPDIEIRILLSENCHICIKKAVIKRSDFEIRKVHHRPFFSPISLHPRLARTMVNLSRIKKGQTLLDPFCGTGGILIEAALIGTNVIGSDIQEKMVKGSGDNLNFFGIKDYNLFCADINDVVKKVEKVDAIATDLPYGRASVLHGDIDEICLKSFNTFNSLLKKGGYAAVVIHDEKFIKIGKDFLSFKEMYKIRVHGSLNRFFCVFKNE